MNIIELSRRGGITPYINHPAAVEVLTKAKGVSYDDYLEGVRRNWISRKVKITDMLRNLSDAPTERQIIKYAKGLLFLKNH